MAFNWTCPHCNRPQTVVDQNFHRFSREIYVGDTRYNNPGVWCESVACSNPDCKEIAVNLGIADCEFDRGRNWRKGQPIAELRIWPESSAKPQPAYIPKPIKDDYIEACRIVDLSPKASATLARRCMQGMIRDFCGINERTLYLQIETLERLNNEGSAPKGVFDETISALHNVRKVGNIGAHMENDINLIVDVDPNEATILIELIETLFEEWYIARHQREERLSKLNAIASDKEAARKGQTEDKPEGHS